MHLRFFFKARIDLLLLLLLYQSFVPQISWMQSSAIEIPLIYLRHRVHRSETACVVFKAKKRRKNMKGLMMMMMMMMNENDGSNHTYMRYFLNLARKMHHF